MMTRLGARIRPTAYASPPSPLADSDRLQEYFWKDERHRTQVETTQPIRWIGQPDESAAPLYLAPDEASFVTGQVFVLDGETA